VLFAFITTVSYLRALSSHMYGNEGEELSYLDQMFDSTTIPGHPLLTELWAPLGQRYHALHHVFPSIPYHSLGIAHRRLMRDLPPDAPYRKTVRAGLIDSLRRVWQQSREIDQPS
jgi:fatty acid desaturase